MAAPAEEPISDYVVIPEALDDNVAVEPVPDAEEPIPGAVAPGEGEGIPAPGAVDPALEPMEIEAPGEEGVTEENTTTATSTPAGPPKPTRKDQRMVEMPELINTLKKGHNSNKPVKVLQSFCDLDDNPPDKVLDLCLIMDCTGSMQAWIKHCKETLHDVIDDSMEEDEGSRVRVAFIGYRDFCDRDLYDVHDFTYLESDMKSFISKRKAKGGGDAPEDIQGALHIALNELSWMENSIRVAYLVADAPCHGQQYHSSSDDYPQGNPLGLVMEDLVREFSNREILFSCYKITDSTEQMFDMMQAAYNEGGQEDGFEFIDLRGQLAEIAPARVRRMKPTRASSRSRGIRPEIEEYATASMAMPESASAAPLFRSRAPASRSVMRSAETRSAYSDGMSRNLRVQKAKHRSLRGW